MISALTMFVDYMSYQIDFGEHGFVTRFFASMIVLTIMIRDLKIMNRLPGFKKERQYE